MRNISDIARWTEARRLATENVQNYRPGVLKENAARFLLALTNIDDARLHFGRFFQGAESHIINRALVPLESVKPNEQYFVGFQTQPALRQGFGEDLHSLLVFHEKPSAYRDYLLSTILRIPLYPTAKAPGSVISVKSYYPINQLGATTPFLLPIHMITAEDTHISQISQVDTEPLSTLGDKTNWSLFKDLMDGLSK
jgi:hypothetical protein